MANTYSQIFYHVVIVVKRRECLITKEIKEDLYKYITGIIKNKDQKLYIINGMPDHVHLLIGCKANVMLSDLVKEIKEHSTKYLNTEKKIKGKFYWQEGFGAFSVSYGHVDRVVNYIKNQEEHHRTKTFKQEYVEFLKENSIDYKEEYIFEEVLS
jgi:putative transposase